LGNNDVKEEKEKKANSPKASERETKDLWILQGRHKSAVRINA